MDRRYLASTLSDLSMGSESIMSVCYCELEYGVLRTVFVSYFFVIVTVIVTVIRRGHVAYFSCLSLSLSHSAFAMFIL